MAEVHNKRNSKLQAEYNHNAKRLTAGQERRKEIGRQCVKVIRLTDSHKVPALVEGSVLQPKPGRGELLVRVCAAGMTPTELLWYPTSHSKNGEKRSRAIPGHEFSGIIVALGEHRGWPQCRRRGIRHE